MFPPLVRSLFFPLHEWLKGHPTRAALREARRWDRMSAGEAAAAQLFKLRKMITHAAEHTSYYGDAFREAGVVGRDLKTLCDLRRFPLLERAALRTRRDDFVATDRARRMTEIATGGSTGEPVTVFVDVGRAAVNTAARIRARDWWGIRMGEREAVLWASPVEIGAQDVIRGLRDRFLNTRLYSAFEGSDTGLTTICEGFARYRPAVVYGYASSIHLLARHVLNEGLPGERYGIRALFATAEGLRPEQREEITKAFGAPVGGEYGARDAGLITHECPAGGHHILAEGMVVEVLRSDGEPAAPGERGEIVATHLEAFGFPLIRYRTGDVAVQAEGPCGCGLNLPRLEKVEGRATDFLLAADGRLLHALGAIYILRVMPGVGRFQVEQESLERLTVRLVREAGFPDDGEVQIRDGFRKLLRGTVEVDVQFVEAIAVGASRKHRYVISPVAQEAFRGRAEPTR